MILQNSTSNNVQEALEKTLRYLSRHEVTRWELRRWLRRKGYAKPVCRNVVRYCLERKYVRDAETLRWRLRKAIQKAWGRERVMWEWKRKGIPEHVVERFLDRYYPLEREIRVCRTWLKHQKNQRNLLRKLGRRGFSEACIETCWERLTDEES